MYQKFWSLEDSVLKSYNFQNLNSKLSNFLVVNSNKQQFKQILILKPYNFRIFENPKHKLNLRNFLALKTADIYLFTHPSFMQIARVRALTKFNRLP